jgi:hypothetical protein
VPRWNGKIETGGTSPPLREYSRNPTGVKKKLEALASEHDSNLVDITWQRGSWIADVTFEDGDARGVLDVLEAADVRELLSTDEKEEDGATQSYE